MSSTTIDSASEIKDTTENSGSLVKDMIYRIAISYDLSPDIIDLLETLPKTKENFHHIRRFYEYVQICR